MTIFTEFYHMIKDMIIGKYPDYVMKGRIESEIPIFMYHHVDEKDFREQLQFLKDNGYQTLNMGQLDQLLFKRLKPSPKNILLTFDDGLDDLYSIVYPLLSFYKFRGVAFIAPNWIGEKGMVSWQQILEMHYSGVIDFQSHSYTHGRIHISPKIIDFFHPDFPYHYRWQFPLIAGNHDHFNKQLPPFGMPIYQFSSSLSESKKYLGNRILEAFCIDYVKNRGTKDFFKNSLWRLQLKKAVRKFSKDRLIESRYETDDEQNDRIKKEIMLSKEMIKEKLPGKEVIAFSYPYLERSEIADRLLRECGYRFVLGGIKANSTFNFYDGKHIFLRRVNGDFIYRLPGNNRSSLLKLFYIKGIRRILHGQMY